ncbi:hypothetical protein NUITMVS2_22990 [Shewanella xiamenensis]|nr:hypothetical protein NUITMVS2_22990 [Shewanella xiamenensis]
MFLSIYVRSLMTNSLCHFSLETNDAYIAKTTAGGVIVEFESAIALLRQEKEQKITPALLV